MFVISGLQVPGLSGSGTSALAGEPELITGWPLSKVRLNAFRNTRSKLLVTNLHPSSDPQFHENQVALKAQKHNLPGREISPNPSGGYQVKYAGKKWVFYSAAGKTQLVGLINSEAYPQKTVFYNYPSGNLKSITLSFSPRDTFVFSGEGELIEAPPMADQGLKGRVATRVFEDDDAELQRRNTGGTGESANDGRDNRLWHQASYQRKVAEVGRKLLTANNIQQSISFSVIETKTDVQAYAHTPSGTVQITSELLRYVSSDDELAGVLGHELAHVLLNHRVKATNGFAVNYKGYVFRDEYAVNYDELQSREIAADARGVRLAMKAGYDPWGLHSALQKILSDSDDAKLGRSSHPLGSQRLKILARQIQSLEMSNQAISSQALGNPQAPASLYMAKLNQPVALPASQPMQLGVWNEASARREVLSHSSLSQALSQALPDVPEMDPDSKVHLSVLNGQALVKGRMLRYSEFIGPYAALMKDSWQGVAGYDVFFPQVAAYPAYNMEGHLRSFSLCNQANYPRTCYTMNAGDKRLTSLNLEVSDSAGFGFDPQGQLINFRRDNVTYNAQRQPVSISKVFR